MAQTMDLKTVVKHLANGSINDSLCVVCLLPFTDELYENVFTAICKKDEEYCIADVLKEVCHLEIQDTDSSNICLNCFQSASAAYQFYLQAKRSYEILNFYTDQLLANTENLDIPEEDSNSLLCIPLPDYIPETPKFEYGLDGIGQRIMGDECDDAFDDEFDDSTSQEEKVLLIVENEKVQDKVPDKINSGSEDDNVLMIVNEKRRKKRNPMVYISCMHCPVRYRFMTKLKDHVKKVHNMDMYYCRICKLITDNKATYLQHIVTHKGEHQCSECPAVFRRQESLNAHLKGHEQERKQLENLTTGNMCEICGVVFPNADALATHASRHERALTCYYCGRMYKALTSFEAHIKKHEALLKNKNKKPIKDSTRESTSNTEDDSNSKRSICGECGKSFVDERSLLWHQRLHDNDRPFVCDICGRGFVSLNRRNQHARCAHSKPSRRCPLCPALFHLTSMVNTHIKKVHLNTQQKRRNRSVKHANVFWKTETVPIQELSVSIQNQLLEMQTEVDIDWSNPTKQPVESITPKLAKKPRRPVGDSKQLHTPLALKAELTDDVMIQEQFDLDQDVDEDMI